MRLVLGALTLLLVAALAALAIQASSGRAADRPFPPAPRLALQVDPAVTAADRAWVATAILTARPAARDLLIAVSGQVEVVLAGPDSCPREHVSCVRAGDHGDGRHIVVALQRDHLDEVGTPRGRFLVLHELAHAVDAAMLGSDGRRAFERALRTTAPALPCTAGAARPGCIPVHELFADEFARWAGRFAGSLSTYATPALIGDAQFAALLQQHARPRGVGELFGAWPE
jgi:hypothetical protein